MTKLKKHITFLFLLLCTCCTFAQTGQLQGKKYYEDLGFGYQSLLFKPKQQCLIESGHSTFKYKTKASWQINKDTVVVIAPATKTKEADTAYYYFKNDTLFNLDFIENKLQRGTALINQTENKFIKKEIPE